MPVPVIVYPPDPSGAAACAPATEVLGVARSRKDVADALRRAGLEGIDEELVATTSLIEWHGGGPDAWPPPQ